MVVVAVAVAVVTIGGCGAALPLFGVVKRVVVELEEELSHCGGRGHGQCCVGCVVALRWQSQSRSSSLLLVGGVVLALIVVAASGRCGWLDCVVYAGCPSNGLVVIVSEQKKKTYKLWGKTRCTGRRCTQMQGAMHAEDL